MFFNINILSLMLGFFLLIFYQQYLHKQEIGILLVEH
uniref:Uncharacterized protein n=1 Tax=Chondria tumulosa TaxID=2740715 RepID=A0A896SU50_9FLOR|nr:hypothetical protein K8K75_pgp136 [Chondria tumulosa]QSD57071.1 hypothetical protein [Chondria tumulosa]